MYIVYSYKRTVCALQPKYPNFGSTVNTPESKVLVLENCSECDVTYKLFYIANKEPPSRRSSKGENGQGIPSRSLHAIH